MAGVAHCIKNFCADQCPQRRSNTITLAKAAQGNWLIPIYSLRAANASGDVMVGEWRKGPLPPSRPDQNS